MMAIRGFGERLSSLAFYIGLDLIVGMMAYVASQGEADLSAGQLMIRVMTAVILANGIVGGPDAMLFWREAGRRVEAEAKLDEEMKEHKKARRERNEARAKIRELEEELGRRDRRNGGK